MAIGCQIDPKIKHKRLCFVFIGEVGCVVANDKGTLFFIDDKGYKYFLHDKRSKRRRWRCFYRSKLLCGASITTDEAADLIVLRSLCGHTHAPFNAAEFVTRI
jgi:hypothetical protein